MAPCGPPPPRAAAARAAAAATAAARAAAKPGATAIHAAATSSIEQIYRQYSDVLAATSHATAAAVLISGSTSTHMKANVAATFGEKMFPAWAYFTKLHRRFRPRGEPGQERHAACVAETARSVVCTPSTVPRL